MRCVRARGRPVHRSNAGELRCPPDHRHVEAAVEGPPVGHHLQDPPRLGGIGGFQHRGPADERLRRRSDEHLALGGSLLKSRRRRERRSRCFDRPRVTGSDHELPGLDPDAARGCRRILQLHGGAHGAHGVVLVRDRETEESYEQVADDFFHPTAMAVKDAGRAFV